MDEDVEMAKQANKLFAEFKALVDKRNRAEKWFDEPTTTDKEREKWKETIFRLNDDIAKKVKELETIGLEVDKELIWYGISNNRMEGLECQKT